MIILPENREKNGAYKSSVGSVLRQCGTTLEIWAGSVLLKITFKNNKLGSKISPNPVWGKKRVPFCPHSGKSACFSIGYDVISECKITPIPTVYKQAFCLLISLSILAYGNAHCEVVI